MTTTISPTDIKSQLKARKEQVDQALNEVLPPPATPPRVLHEAMRYAIFAGGKRIRPLLVLESCALAGGNEKLALPAACAIELIHTYSLIHDDLPCMDNDDVRRGKPTCHKVYGTANAILCGDSLLTLAFEVLAGRQIDAGVQPNTALKVASVIAIGAGHLGMVAGQVMDMEEQGKEDILNPDILHSLHNRKTGALIAACCEVGALIGNADEAITSSLRYYGQQIGLAFQIADDLLDVKASDKQLGKTTGKDAALSKLTFPATFGVERSEQLAHDAMSNAICALNNFDGHASLLQSLAQFIVERKN